MIASLAVLPLLLSQPPLLHPLQDPDDLGPFPSVIEQVRLDTWAELLLETDALPGFAVGMVRGDQRWLGGYGETVPGNGLLPGALTRYEIGSLTKIFTGVLLSEMALREDVQIEQYVDELLPTGVLAPANEESRIQLVHLATHTAGLPRLPPNLDGSVDRPYENYSTQSLVSAMALTRLTSIPGRLYNYSNFGAGLLGSLLASSQRMGYERLLTERVLGPLGMFHTTVTRTPESEGRMAPPFAAGIRPVAPWLFGVLAPCGGLVSSTTDMLAFLEANLGKAPDTLMPALSVASSQIWTNPANSIDMGLGWHRNRANGVNFHSGQTGGYYSFIAMDTERKLGLVVLANSSSALVEDWGQRAFQLLRGDSYIPPLRYRRQRARSQEEVRNLTGNYDMNMLGNLAVREVEGRLFAKLENQESLRLYADEDPESGDLFFYRAVEAELEFDRGSDGKGTMVRLKQSGRVFTGERADDR